MGTACQSSQVGAGRELVASSRKGLTPGTQGSGSKWWRSKVGHIAALVPIANLDAPARAALGQAAHGFCSTNNRGEGLSLTAGWALVRIWSARSDAPGAGASLRRARLSGVRQQTCQRITQRRRYYPVAGCAV